MELPLYLDSLLQKSSIPSEDIVTFLRDMRSTPSGPLITSKLLAAKMQSASDEQALSAFNFLEAALEAESEGSIEFSNEIGRYRFLNDIVRMISPRFWGDKTSKAVKDKAISFLKEGSGPKRRKWFPSEHSKIRNVYESLCQSGAIPESVMDTQNVDSEEAEFQKSIFERAENASTLKKLLQSKDRQDLEAANRLIKNLVDEEAKRNERRAELHSLCDRVETSTSLLKDLLSQTTIDNEIVDELVSTCQTLREKMGGIATETGIEASALLHASDKIEQVLMLYEKKKDDMNTLLDNVSPSSSGNLVSSGYSVKDDIMTSMSSLTYVDELLMKLDTSNSASKISTDNCNDLLSFEDAAAPKPNNVCTSDRVNEALKPTPFDEIAKLSKELMEKSMNASGGCESLISLKPQNRKVPLNEINVSKVHFSDPTSPGQNRCSHNQPILDLEPLTNDGLAKTSFVNPDSDKNQIDPKKSLLDKAQPTEQLGPDSLVETFSGSSNIKTFSVDEVFDITKIKSVDLQKVELDESVKPVSLILNDDVSDSISLNLMFGKLPDLPPQVWIAIITLTNKSSRHSLLNYVFQLLPPKNFNYKAKLLPPSVTELPPWKRQFLPAPILNQIAVMVPYQSCSSDYPNSSSSHSMNFILSYCMEDETRLIDGKFDVPSQLFEK